MKTMLQENGGYKLFAETRVLDVSQGLIQLTFSSSYDGAKNPHAERKIYEFFLNKESVDKLKALL